MTVIRSATPADADAIWALLEPVFAAGETYAVDPAISRGDALRMWCDAPMACYVADLNGEVVGTYYIKPNQQGGGAHVCNCGYVVGEAARGRGVAAAMCRHSQLEAQRLGFLAMQFNLVMESNAGAIALWERLGFATVGRLPRVFRHPKLGLVDARVMLKSLSGAPVSD